MTLDELIEKLISIRQARPDLSNVGVVLEDEEDRWNSIEDAAAYQVAGIGRELVILYAPRRFGNPRE